ncbi:MAG: hypothetical protein U0470_06845 [Anaerolineae bacterium]
MATFLEAVQAFGPRLVYNRTATTATVANTLAGRTGLKYGQVLLVLRELHEVLIQYLETGTPVELEGFGRCRPTMNRAGHLRIAVTIDGELASAVDHLENYAGEVLNRANIGLDDDGYKLLWDTAHPDDPLELPERSPKAAERAASRAARRVARMKAAAVA